MSGFIEAFRLRHMLGNLYLFRYLIIQRNSTREFFLGLGQLFHYPTFNYGINNDDKTATPKLTLPPQDIGSNRKAAMNPKTMG